jgi:plastocyanin
MRKLFVSALVVGLLAAVAAQALASTRSVKVGDNFFGSKGTKPTISVAKGTKVTWRWKGSEYHNVRVRKGPRKFHSDVKNSGRYSKKLRRRGTYKIVCDVHPDKMRMTLVVY